MLWLAAVSATVVSTAALTMAAGADRRAVELAVSPFGWNRVILVHVLCSLLLSSAVARTLRAAVPELRPRWTAAVWVAAGLLLASCSVVAGDFVAHALNTAAAGYWPRMLVRILWCTVLQAPWFMAALAIAYGADDRPAAVVSVQSHLALALGMAVLVPMSYMGILVESQTKFALGRWQAFDIERARRVVRRLCEVGSTRDFGRTRKLGGRAQETILVSPRVALEQLNMTAEAARQEVARLEVGGVDNSERIELTSWLASLGRVAEAKATIGPLAQHDAAAALRLAEIYHAGDERAEACHHLERALQLAQSAGPSDPEQMEANVAIQSRAYDLLALNVGKLADYEAAERYLLEALDRLPTQRAVFHRRLGAHYDFIGRPFRAIEHYRKAAELAPQENAEPEGIVAKVLASGAPIGLARPAASRYR